MLTLGWGVPPSVCVQRWVFLPQCVYNGGCTPSSPPMVGCTPFFLPWWVYSFSPPMVGYSSLCCTWWVILTVLHMVGVLPSRSHGGCTPVPLPWWVILPLCTSGLFSRCAHLGYSPPACSRCGYSLLPAPCCGVFSREVYTQRWLFSREVYTQRWVILPVMPRKPGTERGVAQG